LRGGQMVAAISNTRFSPYFVLVLLRQRVHQKQQSRLSFDVLPLIFEREPGVD
jgi:hypothetical protein